MKVKNLSALAGLGGALILSCSAQAGVVGLYVTEVAPTPDMPAPPGGILRTIYHVYAEFDGPGYHVNAWGGGGDLGNGIIQNLNQDGSGLGTGFVQVGGAGGNTAPSYATSARSWDTYMTIGVRFGAEGPGGIDATSVIPNTPAFIAGTQWTAPASGGGVFITPDDAQGNADYIDSGSDTANRVLLMQLVVNVGQHVAGTIGVNWEVSGVAGATTTPGLTFNSVPAPGALALLGLAGLVGSRRRRA
jgi:MYXO-CTERM domain-containing protein